MFSGFSISTPCKPPRAEELRGIAPEEVPEVPPATIAFKLAALLLADELEEPRRVDAPAESPSKPEVVALIPTRPGRERE